MRQARSHRAQWLRIGLACLFVAVGLDSTMSARGAEPKAAGRISQRKFPDWSPAPLPAPAVPPYVTAADDEMRATPQSSWQGKGAAVALICFNHTGELALIALADGSCHVVNPKTGESKHGWQTGKTAKITAMEMTFDGKRVVVQHAGDGTLYVHAVEDGKLLRSVGLPSATITAFAVGPDPRLLAIGTDRGLLQIHDLDTGDLLQEEQMADGQSRVTALAFSNDSEQLFASREGTTNIGVFQLPQLYLDTSIEQPCGTPLRLASSWSGNYLMVLCADSVAQLILLKEVPDSKVQVHHRFGAAAIRHGGPQNWFLLQSNSRMCSYLGKESFEYYSLFDGGTAGGQLADEKPMNEVAMAPDGHCAATGFADGSVRFYRLPGPGNTASMRNGDFGGMLVRLLDAEKYDELDEQANRALAQTAPDARGWSHASLVTYNLSNLSGKRTQEAWTAHLEKLGRWLDAKPDSRAARLVLATATTYYGWFLRGSDIAARTSEEAFRGFREQLEKADELFRAADAGPASAPVCAGWITVAMGLGKDKQELIRIWKRGTEDAPGYIPLHDRITTALLPRWLGEQGDVGRHAEQALRDLPGKSAQLAYAEMATSYLNLELPITLGMAGFDLDKLDQAAQTALRLCPENSGMTNLAMILACVRGDHVAARERLPRLAGDFDKGLWKHKLAFQHFRRWTQLKHVTGDSELAFLASWLGLRQVSFAGDDAELITLGADGSAQIHTWDVRDLRSQRTYPLPPMLWPSHMSRNARFVLAVQQGPQRQVIVLDQNSRRPLLWPGVDATRKNCISDDERFLAVYGKGGQIDVFDLENPVQEPAHQITVDQPPSLLEFLLDQKECRLVIADAKGSLRALSEEGKDLIPPVALPRAPKRLCPFPGSPQVLAASDGLLILANMATGTTKTLSDEPATDRGRTHYSTLCSNGAGTLLAAARIDPQPQKAERPCEIEIWDVAGHRLRVLAGHDAPVETMSFSGDGKRLASGDQLGFIKIWNLESINH